MKKTITACVWASLTALLLSACGGKGFLGDRNDALEGEDADAAVTAPSSTDVADGANSDDTAAEADDNADDGDEQTGDSPGADDAVDPDPSDPASDDADPGDPDPAADDDADPGDPSDDADPGTDPIDPDPVDPTEPAYDACADKACGDECNSCPPDAFCITGPGYCSADGACSPEEPVCKPVEGSCPEFCPIPKICQVCEGSDACAEPIIECNADGSCGDITGWECPKPEPEPTVCPDQCAVPEICKLCDDGSCATANVACNQDGSCGDVTFECADVQCKTDADCGEYMGDGPCIDCAAAEGDAAEAPGFAPPEDPLPVSYECPRYQCVESMCKVKTPSCEYDPCEGKNEGDSCQLCAPDDPACSEIDVLKACQGGKCEAAVSASE